VRLTRSVLVSPTFSETGLKVPLTFRTHGQAIVLGDQEGKPWVPLAIIEHEIAFPGVRHGDEQVDPLVEKKIAPFGLGRDSDLGRGERAGGQKAERAEGGQMSHTAIDARAACEENKMELFRKPLAFLGVKSRKQRAS